jgi:hypothetical protein
MNLANLKSLATAFVLVAFVSGCNRSEPPSAASATPTPAAEATPASAAPVPAPEAGGAAETEAAPVVIPDSADAIWEAIDKHSAELKSTIESGSLGEVHHHAFAIRDLVAALPAHSPTLPAADQAKLEGEVKFVTTLASRLDETGDAGDKAGSQENYDKLVAVLNGITRTK